LKLFNQHLNLDDFWSQLHAARQTLLLLDFDGTLAPFVVDPAAARPYPGVSKLLETIAAGGRTRLVVISGRDIDSLSRCLELDLPLELWGCHGWQRRLPRGQVQQQELPREAAARLAQAARLVHREGWERHLEIKPVALALHWRGLAAAQAATMRERIGRGWRRLTDSGALHLKAFDGGLELRCPEINKGTAVVQLLREIGTGTPLAYLGDDVTDEDAFAALAGRGLRVLVRSRQRPTAADLWLRPPEELLWFLRRWQKVSGG
jgi:trehalose-phosphatase